MCAGMKFSYDFSDGSTVKSFQMDTYEADRERRMNRRRPVSTSVYCRRVGAADGRLFSGDTVNVSPGGVLVKMKGVPLRDGELVSVEMTVPQASGIPEQNGSFSGYARVVRINDFLQPSGSEKEVAMEFCQSPQFCF